MVNEDTGTGFLARLKNVFSSSHHHAEANLNASTGNVLVLSVENPEAEELARTNTEEVDSISQQEEESITEKEIALRTVKVTSPACKLPTEKDLDIRFATKFIASGGKFIFCESVSEAVEGMRMLKLENAWSHIFCWENEIKDAFAASNFQKGSIGFTIENSDAAVSLCECLVSDEGTIILNPKQASRRRLSCFPKTHIILTDIAHLTASEADGLEKFYQLHKGELPSVLKIGYHNNGHFYDKQRLILNAEGPDNVFVFLVDQIIPPSLRP